MVGNNGNGLVADKETEREGQLAQANDDAVNEHSGANHDNEQVNNNSRRKFLVNSGYVLGTLAVGGALSTIFGCTDNNGGNAQEPTATPDGGKETEIPNYNRALMYFTPAQFRIVDSATERIFPEDDNGPGAKKLGVAFFIDHQLAGDWGFNGRDYMSPPFFTGEKVQGYQGRLKRKEIFDIGIQELENYSLTKYSKGFAELEGAQQDEVLKVFENEEANLPTISESFFFRTLRSATLEGVYSDPLYGGNANMEGWRMRSYPGSQMSYLNIIDKDFTQIEPSSLQAHLASH
ncbi:gluconate 2-dehydrogenase subunit 3 family protein [Paenibacillus sp. NPDC057967]|uniref:gluconate 2-dehydrogenase subunit 3 family protein n=1 Tax=Paenibacillus sp. NPDC057967 TaxID=3346293 RepID=UPI0036DF4157